MTASSNESTHSGSRAMTGLVVTRANAADEEDTWVVPPGHFAVIPQGRSATALLWAIAGVATAPRPLVEVGGVTIETPEQAAAAGVCLVPEGLALVPTLTAYENVLLGLLIPRDPDPAARAREALTALGLDEVADHLVEELSGGQQQRVALARTLARPAQVILADEPTSALDAANRVRVLSLLQERQAAGAAVIITSSDPETTLLATVPPPAFLGVIERSSLASNRLLQNDISSEIP